MNLAFYYHIPVGVSNNQLSLPGYIGLFVDALARNVYQLYLIAHTHPNQEDFVLTSENIVLIDLGKKTSSLHRGLFPSMALKKINGYIKNIDAFLVRSPSPLAPAFAKYRKKGVPVYYYIVGSYSHGGDFMQIKSPRDLAIRYFLKWNHYKFMQSIQDQKVLVNSPALLGEISNVTKKIKLIQSSTLMEDDLLKEKKARTGGKRKVLYTGRLDFSKGLMELTMAVGQLVSSGYHLELHLVGWEDDPSKSVENEITRTAHELGIAKHVVFHGKKKVGPELNEMYRMADIYCIPSYHEGFPRTIWEAMANRLPVIATRVGGIPFFLKNKEDAILIEPRSTEQIVNALTTTIDNPEIVDKLIINGFEKAKQNTVTRRAQELISYLSEDNSGISKF